jgi:predicted transcriptional regulator
MSGEKNVESKQTELEESMKILFHPFRARIILLLTEKEEMYPNQIVESLGEDRSGVVYHLNILERAGFVKSEYKMVSSGKFAKFYSVDMEKVKEAVMKGIEFYRQLLGR